MLKGWKTIIGIALAGIIALGQTIGIQPVEQLPDWLEAALAIIGIIVGVYGRATADTPMFRSTNN